MMITLFLTSKTQIERFFGNEKLTTLRVFFAENKDWAKAEIG